MGNKPGRQPIHYLLKFEFYW